MTDNDTCKELSEDHVVKDRPHNLGIEISSTGWCHIRMDGRSAMPHSSSLGPLYFVICLKCQM